jgi:hypothetical protein
MKEIEKSGSARAEFGLHASDLAEFPGGGDKRFEKSLLDCTLGSDVGLETGEHGLELFAIFGADGQFGGGKAVGAGVLRGAGFALGSAGPGAEAGIGGVR